MKRLVGTTFKAFARNSSVSVLIMLHNGSAPAPVREVIGGPYAALADEFYQLAELGSPKGMQSRARMAFGQMDLRKNDPPAGTPLVDPEGVALLLYPIDAKDAPRGVPDVGVESLKGTEPAIVRSQLTHLLLTHLPKQDQGVAKEWMHRREKEVEELWKKSQTGYDPAAAADKGATAAQRRRAPSAAASSGQSASRGEACDTCLMMVSELTEALDFTKAELQLSHDAAAKKQAQIDGVQKAQTKRWLKNEYRVALAEAVEDRLETLCERNDTFARRVKAVCRDDEAGKARGWAGRYANDDPEACLAAGAHHCRTLSDDSAEPLLRGTLDGKGPAACAELLPSCAASRVETLPGFGHLAFDPEEEADLADALMKDAAGHAQDVSKEGKPAKDEV